MKGILKLGVVMSVVASMGLYSCEEVKPLDMAEVDRYQDSILHMIPSASVQVKEVRDFNTEAVSVKLILGNARLHDATPEEIQQIAVNAGQLALSVFSTNVKSGMLIVTKEARNHPDADPADGIKADMKLDSLRAAAKK